MHAGAHYKLRRLASTHTSEDSSERTEDVSHDGSPEPVHESLICRVFMRPPDDEPTVKYGAVVRETLETVDLLHMSLIAMQNTHPLLEILELANTCRQVVSLLSESVSDPILFAGSFTEYYLRFLKAFKVDRDGAVENIRYALGGGIPSIVNACEKERGRISDAKDVFEGAATELDTFLHDHGGTDEHIAEFHPFTFKNVQTLNWILHKFNQMENFCRYYENYFGHIQYRHLHGLLEDFDRGLIGRPSQEESDIIMNLWTRYDRFTLHFPAELELGTEFFQATSRSYRVRSTEFDTSTASTIYSESYSESSHDDGGWRGTMHKCRIPVDKLRVLRRQPRKFKIWICDGTLRWYRRIRFWLYSKQSVG